MRIDLITMKDGNEILLPQPECLRDCITLIQSDMFRCVGRVVSVKHIIFQALFHPFKNPLLWFRLCRCRGLIFHIAVRMWKKCQMIYKIDMPFSTRVGFGLYMGHGICIVINGRTVIGNNVNLSQFLNIGTNHESPAVIGDNVYIGPMVCLVEDVQIGKNSKIGAGAVVTKDVPENCVAVGIPAKKIKQSDSPNTNCWKLPEYKESSRWLDI